jgi:hypothetical protein
MRLCAPTADCQGNYAATVRAILPFGVKVDLATSTTFCDRSTGWDRYLQKKKRLGAARSDIMQLTDHWTRLGETHDRHHGCEVCCPPTARYAQSPSRACDRFPVSGPRVLRPPRCRSGQVRDAATGSARRALGDGGVRRLRLFVVRVLRSQERLSAWRITGPDPSPARTSTPAQVERTNSGISAPMPWPRSGDVRGGAGSTGPRQVWNKSPCSQHRTGAGSPAKKGATLPIAECTCELWTARYEDLGKRVLTFSEANSAAGWEQTLVIRQGLRAWMTAWPQVHSTRPPISTPTTRTDPDLALTAPQQAQLAQILASMILHSRTEVPL